MHVAVPPRKAKWLVNSLKNEHLTRELDIQVTPLTQRKDAKKDAVMGVRIYCVGNDRPGMLASVSEKLASKGMSIEDITTKLRIGANGNREFVIEALVSSTELL